MATLLNYDIRIMRYDVISTGRPARITFYDDDASHPLIVTLSRRPTFTMFFLPSIAHYHFLYDDPSTLPQRSSFEDCDFDLLPVPVE